jgi:hypothetical protein
MKIELLGDKISGKIGFLGVKKRCREWKEKSSGRFGF